MMPLLGLLGGWRMILATLTAAAVLALIGGFWLHYQSLVAENARLAAANAVQAQQLDDAARVNAAQEKALADLQRLHARDLAAIRTADAAAARAADRLRTLEMEASRAPAADDGPVSSLYRRYLAGLRAEQSAAPAGGHDGATGQHPAGTAGVPAGTAAAARR